MKGIILAGGSGTRMYPGTLFTSKQTMMVYDKPLIYYPISTLMLAGIREILIISTPKHTPGIKDALGDGSQFGCSFQYVVQEHPEGLAQAFTLGADFIGEDKVLLGLGDNVFNGDEFRTLLPLYTNTDGAVIFGYKVENPSAYGVIELDSNNLPISIEEKPPNPKPNSYAIPGVYYCDNDVVAFARTLTKSPRGEFEIVGVLNKYLQQKRLKVVILGSGTAWLDTGTHDDLLAAGNYVQIIQKRQGQQIACLEEIAYTKGYITAEQLEKLIQPLMKNYYGQYLRKILDAR